MIIMVSVNSLPDRPAKPKVLVEAKAEAEL
jgi:hypothetical protein